MTLHTSFEGGKVTLRPLRKKEKEFSFKHEETFSTEALEILLENFSTVKYFVNTRYEA